VSGDAGGGKVMLGGDWGRGNPNKALVNNQSAALRELQDRQRDNAVGRCGDHDRCLGKEQRQWRQGRFCVDSQTTFAGTIFARGGGDSAGNGGFVEVSSKGALSFAGSVDTRAPNGLAGTLLLDPQDIVIGADGTMTVAALQSALASSTSCSRPAPALATATSPSPTR